MASRVRTTLANLSPARGALHNQKRVGRGQGSGYGGTSGRGHKGQKARTGSSIRPGFEGGQTPLTELFPKRGFHNPNGKTWAPVNLDRIQHWINQGRLNSTPERPITARELLLSGCIHDAADGVKILGDGASELKTPIYIVASRASKSAISAIEATGGKVVCKYYNDLALKDCIQGRTDRISAAPTRREDIVWYSLHRHRGFLSRATQKSLEGMPFVEDRWKHLADQLVARWRNEQNARLAKESAK